MAKNNPARFVVDTNLLLSASLIEGTPSQQGVFYLLRNGKLVFSLETYAELKEIFMRSKFDRYGSRESRMQYLALYQSVADFVTPERQFSLCRDEQDNKFLDIAVASNAEALITGDEDLLVLKEIEGIPILSMANFFKKQ